MVGNIPLNIYKGQSFQENDFHQIYFRLVVDTFLGIKR